MKEYSVEWVSIVNRALAAIGSTPLINLDEGTDTANHAAVLLPQAIEACYASLPLADIAKYQTLPQIRLDVKGSYKYSYKKPEAIVRILEVLPSDAEWEMGADAIFSNSDNLTIKYVSLPDRPEDLPVYMRNLVVYKLTALLAKPVAHDDALTANYENLYTSELSRILSFSPQWKNKNNYRKNRRGL